jgi:hypothetical protein
MKPIADEVVGEDEAVGVWWGWHGRCRARPRAGIGQPWSGGVGGANRGGAAGVETTIGARGQGRLLSSGATDRDRAASIERCKNSRPWMRPG